MSGFYDETNDVAILRERIEELSRIRQGYAAHLGSSLYDATKYNAELRWGRESLYDGIAACDSEREALLARIQKLGDDTPEEVQEAPQNPYENASEEVESPVEEANEPAFEPLLEDAISADDLDETTIISVDQTMVQPQAAFVEPEPPAVCPTCGAAINPGDKFCMECGTQLAQDAPLEPIRLAEANVCPSCGSPTDPSFKFCMSCGYKLV